MTNEEWSTKLKKHWAELPDQNETTMTSKDIQDYIEKDLGQPMRHDPYMLLEATQETASTFGFDEWKVLRFMLANEPMFATHSYGFHTRLGRAIRAYFEFIYGS
tara:strand:- start:486 stop:797 length:312 start_codon:yes stop_codon:yes gene_type:complete